MASALLSVECPSCNKRLRAPTSAAGKTVKCPSCQTPVSVPTAGADAVSAPLVAQPVPQSAPLAPVNPFDFAPAPVSAPAPEAPPEKVDPKRCVLCGNHEASEDFFICASAEDGLVRRWMHFRVRACEECSKSIGRFRSFQIASGVAALVSLVVVAAVGILVGTDKLPVFALAVSVVPLLASCGAVWLTTLKRKQLMERPELAPTLKRLRAAFHKSTGLWEVAFTPQTEVDGGAPDKSDQEW